MVVIVECLINDRGQLVTILEKLKPLKSQLDNHEPPHLSPELVSEQLHNIEVLEKTKCHIFKDIVILYYYLIICSLLEMSMAN